jgi:hypothetical protein
MSQDLDLLERMTNERLPALPESAVVNDTHSGEDKPT